MRRLQRVVLCVTVSLGLVFSASLGAEAAGAQSAGGDSRKSRNPPASTKQVTRFIKRQAKIVGDAQSAVFPNAQVTETKPWASCSRIRSRRWSCVWHVAVYEDSTIDPPEEYDPEWPIRQTTLRFCGAPGEGVKSVLHVRQNGRNSYPRRLRIRGGWRMACPLDEFAIEEWNKYGPDWQPNVSEPTAYEQVTLPAPQVRLAPDLLPPPSGEPGGAPPGPMSVAQNYASASRTAHSAEDTFIGCSWWDRFTLDQRYWVYYCFWRLHSLPGASPGIFNNVHQYEGYYWAGERDAYGRAVGRFFLQGTL